LFSATDEWAKGFAESRRDWYSGGTFYSLEDDLNFSLQGPFSLPKRQQSAVSPPCPDGFLFPSARVAGLRGSSRYFADRRLGSKTESVPGTAPFHAQFKSMPGRAQTSDVEAALPL